MFPGVQGSIHTQVIAAKAVCLGEALTPQFKVYAAAVQQNARVLAATLKERGIRIVSGGTDTHIVLLDFSPQGLTGKAVESVLESAGITSNKNPVPFDAPKPADWVGLRLGSSAATTRGLQSADFVELGGIIADLVHALAAARVDEMLGEARKRCAALCARFPIYEGVI